MTHFCVCADHVIKNEYANTAKYLTSLCLDIWGFIISRVIKYFARSFQLTDISSSLLRSGSSSLKTETKQENHKG